MVMRISSVSGIFNAGSTQSVNFAAAGNQKTKQQNTDTVSISEACKAFNTSGSSKDRIQALTDRKQDIMQMKSEYRSKAAEKGLSQDEIQSKIEEYDNMIAEIDRQIAQIRQEDQQKSAQANAEKNKDATEIDTAPKDEAELTEEKKQADQDLMNGLTSVQTTQTNIKAVQFAKRVIQTDSLSYQSFNETTGADQAKAAALSGTATDLDSKIAELNKDLEDAANEIKDASGTKQSVPDKAETYGPYKSDEAESESAKPENNLDGCENTTADDYKTYEQSAIENYLQIANMAEEDESRSSSVNIIA